MPCYSMNEEANDEETCPLRVYIAGVVNARNDLNVQVLVLLVWLLEVVGNVVESERSLGITVSFVS